MVKKYGNLFRNSVTPDRTTRTYVEERSNTQETLSDKQVEKSRS